MVGAKSWDWRFLGFKIAWIAATLTQQTIMAYFLLLLISIR